MSKLKAIPPHVEQVRGFSMRVALVCLLVAFSGLLHAAPSATPSWMVGVWQYENRLVWIKVDADGSAYQCRIAPAGTIFTAKGRFVAPRSIRWKTLWGTDEITRQDDQIAVGQKWQTTTAYHRANGDMSASCYIANGSTMPGPPDTHVPTEQEVHSPRIGEEIDAILYADVTPAERLARLRPYAEPMQSMDEVAQKLDVTLCFGSGPGVFQCHVAHSGLVLVFDPDKKLRVMRREARQVHGVHFPEMSLADRGFEWHGYRRWYPN